MIKGDMCLKIIEKGKPKDVIIKEGEVTWIICIHSLCGVFFGTQLEHTSGDKSQRQITSCILKNLSPWKGVQNEISLNLCSLLHTRVVIKSWGPGIFPGYWESGPQLLLLKNRRKIEPKEIPSRLIPRLLVVFTRQLEILVTTLAYITVK